MSEQKLSELDIMSFQGHTTEKYDPDDEKDVDRIVDIVKEKLKEGWMFVITNDKPSETDEVIKFTRKEAINEEGDFTDKEETAEEAKSKLQRIKEIITGKNKDGEITKDREKKKTAIPPVHGG